MRRKTMRMGYGLCCVVLMASGCQFSGSKQQADEQAVTHAKQTTGEQKQQQKPVDTHTPVATYHANEEDEVTNNDFVVEAFPTEDPRTFRLEIRFGENRAGDKVDFPDPAYYKEVALRAGEQPNTCLLGFTDEEGKFNEMSAISGSATKIGIKALKAYYFETQTQ